MSRMRTMALLLALLMIPLAAQTLDLTSASGTAALDGVWRMHAGADAQWAAPEFDDSDWAGFPVSGPAPAGEHHTFRIHVRTRNEPDAALMIGRVGRCYTVDWDGRRLGSFGTPGVGQRSFAPRWTVFPIPGAVRAGEHVIVLSVPGTVGLADDREIEFSRGESRFGARADLEAAAGDLMGRDFRSVLAEILTAFALLLGGFYFLLLPRSLRTVTALPWLGAFLAVRAVLLGVTVWNSFGPLAVPLEWELLPAAVLTRFYVIALVEFACAITGQKTHWIIRVLEGLALLGGLNESPALAVTLGAMGLLAPLGVACVLLVQQRRATAESRRLVWLIVAWSAVFTWSLLAGAHAPGTFLPLPPFGLWTTDAVSLAMIPVVFTLLMRRTEVQQTERKQLLGEMEAAREVQEMLVPATRVRTTGYRIQSAYRPMAEVGGDFFQLFETADQGVLLVTGDVSGKGLRAAMLVAMIIGLLRQRRSDEPGAVLAELNRGLAGRVSGGFVTCEAARFSPDGRVRIANAGHLPPYKNARDLKVESGLPLGMVAEGEWEETALTLEQNDRLVFLSDGVAEARNARGELLGFDRARELSYRPASEIARVAEGWGQQDDITVIAVTHDRDAVPDAGA